MNAANHGCQVRHKGQADFMLRHPCQTLSDLGQMAVTGHAISLEAVRCLGKQEADFGLAPCAGHTGFCICNQAGIVHQPGFQQGQEAKLHGGWIAAGVGHQPCLANLFTVDLRQAMRRRRGIDAGFAPRVRTVRLGRRIYENIRNAMRYIIAVHVPTVGMASVTSIVRSARDASTTRRPALHQNRG